MVGPTPTVTVPAIAPNPTPRPANAATRGSAPRVGSGSPLGAPAQTVAIGMAGEEVPGPAITRAPANLGGDRHPAVRAQPFGTIEIPSIGLLHRIYEGVELPDLHWGPGHWPGTAMPGEAGNAVFAGHRVTHTRPFLDLDRLVAGDRIVLTTHAGRFEYTVTGHEIVSPDDVGIAEPTPTATLTLTACHPKGSAARRYVVRASLAA